MIRTASALLVVTLAFVGAEISLASPEIPDRPVIQAQTSKAKPTSRRVVLLGLRQRGNPAGFATQVSNPASPQYRKFLTQAQYRQRFSATATTQKRVKSFLTPRRGVTRLTLNPSQTVALAIMKPAPARRFFCAKGSGPPSKGICIPKALRGAVRLVSVGEVYQQRSRPRSGPFRSTASSNTGTPQGCPAGLKGKAFAPNQISTAYGVDGLKSRGLDGSGISIATLSSQVVPTAGFKTWANCFGLSTPNVRQFAMPGGQPDTATAPEETVLDIEALASLAPELDRITPIMVPLVEGFPNSFALFMFGALDPSRQGGKLPDILSISDGVCEERFTAAQLKLGQRMLAEAASVGVTALAASGDLGFQGCFTNARGALFPASSPFTTSVGGTDLFLTAGNQISRQVVWSTYATEPRQGVGTGGGPSQTWPRPAFQVAPGVIPALQTGRQTRLSPDIASMASFVPGIATYDEEGGGWGLGGGTSAATPLTAAIVGLTLQQERAAGRPALGSLPPLLYQLARGPDYDSVFFDITEGSSSRKPKSAAGRSAAGGAAQPGYDLATGLGSLRATAFADAVSALP